MEVRMCVSPSRRWKIIKQTEQPAEANKAPWQQCVSFTDITAHITNEAAEVMRVTSIDVF